MPRKRKGGTTLSKWEREKKNRLSKTAASDGQMHSRDGSTSAGVVAINEAYLGQSSSSNTTNVPLLAFDSASKGLLAGIRKSASISWLDSPEHTERSKTRKANKTVAMTAVPAVENRRMHNPRQAKKLLTTAAARASETEAQRTCRQRRDAEATAAARALETEAQRNCRNRRNAEATAAARASETEGQSNCRNRRNAEATAAARAFETLDTRRNRLAGALQYEGSRQCISRPSKLRWSFKAFNYVPLNNFASHPDVQIGSMSKICQFCKAKKWPGEPLGMCCSNGKVNLPSLRDPPQPLRLLLTGTHAVSRGFIQDIRHFNCAFQMTSFGSSYKHEGWFMPTFKVQGQVYHRIGSLQSVNNAEPRFLQVYFMPDLLQQALRRNSYAFPNAENQNPQSRQSRKYSIASGSRLELLLELQYMLHNNNSYVQSFKYALESATSENFHVVIDADKRPTGEHAGRYNAPSSNEVAIILSGDQQNKRDIVISHRDQGLQRISETHRSYDALQYPLLFVYGEDGYHFGIPQHNPTNPDAQSIKTVSCKNFYSFRFMIRDECFNHLHRSQDLFNQYATDMCAKMESERLCFIRANQQKLRCDSYRKLRDAMINDDNPDNIGKVCILPSTFTGSPRYMHEKTQDAMTIVRHYGRPDLFITFTCNTKWKEIEDELFPGQTGMRRHDLAARVFRLKLQKLLDLIKLGEIFGPVQCDMYTIEWQKRGLPHAHILIWLSQKIKSTDIDKIISAELPDPSTDKDLYVKVKAHMVHGPCGPGYRNSSCSSGTTRCLKRYPRQFIRETQSDTDGYPLYRRRRPEDGGYTAMIGNEEIDNRWIIPYCPLLLSIFHAHINVEFCSSVKCIKYICKYVNKGSDAASFGLAGNNDRDEVTQYQVGRYISSSEALWRILGFPIHDRHPSIVKLAVHLEHDQPMFFTNENASTLAEAPGKTTLTGFFKLCSKDDFAKTLLYHQVPSYYTWNNKEWNRRKTGQPVNGHPDIKVSSCLGRVFTVSPNQHELFYLRMLLHEVTGPTSFEDLRTVDNHVHTTYREACLARGMLEDDSRWDETLTEIALTRPASSVRDLFTKLLFLCHISDPNALWLKYRDYLSDDFLHRAQQQLPDTEVTFNDEIYNQALISIENTLLLMGGAILTSYGLPEPNRSNSEGIPTFIIQETSYDTNALARYVTDMEPKLLPDQQVAYQTVINCVFKQTCGIFFLDAPGGTGKTFVTKLILAKVRQEKHIAIAVSSSGIAATLLPGGRTAHSTFKLPLDFVADEKSTCNISKNSPRADLLRRCRLIVWDECTMANKGAIEALDTTLQDIRDCPEPMGGVTVLFSGDFRQTLPVVPKGTRADQVRACLKSSRLWRKITTLRLTTNMRVRLHGDAMTGKFAEDLLLLGDGKVPSDGEHQISVEHLCNLTETVRDLKEAVFPNLIGNYLNHSWLSERAILAPTNAKVSAINSELLDTLPGNSMIFKSIDVNVDPHDVVKYPTEFLNSQNPSGFPPHILQLKVGCPIILLRNVSPPKLCNGTRLVVSQLSENIVYATIITGCGIGEEVIIPKVSLTMSTKDTPYVIRRTQFPVCVAFGMSITKSQGQTLSVAGLHLEDSCFSHGQLYVGCSRVGSRENLFTYIPKRITKNIVYKEVL